MRLAPSRKTLHRSCSPTESRSMPATRWLQLAAAAHRPLSAARSKPHTVHHWAQSSPQRKARASACGGELRAAGRAHPACLPIPRRANPRSPPPRPPCSRLASRGGPPTETTLQNRVQVLLRLRKGEREAAKCQRRAPPLGKRAGQLAWLICKPAGGESAPIGSLVVAQQPESVARNSPAQWLNGGPMALVRPTLEANLRAGERPTVFCSFWKPAIGRSQNSSV